MLALSILIAEDKISVVPFIRKLFEEEMLLEFSVVSYIIGQPRKRVFLLNLKRDNVIFNIETLQPIIPVCLLSIK